MKRRILSVCIAVLLIALTACTPAKQPTGTSSASTTSAMPTISAADKFKSPTTITVTTAKNVYDVKIYPEGQSPDVNDVYASIEKVMGIKFENKFAVPNDAYNQQIKLGMVSGDLPDMFTVGEQDLADLISDGLLEDLTPYYNSYASDNLKKVMNYKDGIAMAPSTRDDKLFGMPNISDAMNSVPILWIRKDWLDALKMEVPKTADEFIALAKAFAENDPDKNNKKDTYGIALSKELDLRFTGVANLFGAYPKIYHKSTDGKYSYGSTAAAVKTTLSKLNELYSVGAIDPEFATKDLTKMAETVSQGKVGIYVGEFFQSLWPLADSVNLIPGADWIAVPMPGTDFVPQVRIHAMGAHVVRKGAKNPEALIIYLNNVVEAGYETPGNAWNDEWVKLSTKYVNNSVNNWMPMLFDLPDANATKLAAYKIADETGNTSNLRPNQKGLYDLILAARGGDKAQWAWPKVYFEGVESALSYKKSIYDAWYFPPTATAKIKGAALKSLEDTAFINIIVGTNPVSDFDKFVTDWNTQGGSDILNEMDASK